MTVVTLVHLLALVAYLALLVRVVARTERTALHWSCALVLLSFAVWCVEGVVRGMTQVPLSVMQVVVNFCAVGWGGFASANLLFTLLLTGRVRTRANGLQPSTWWLLVLLGIFPALTVAAQFSGQLNVNLTLTEYGWITRWADSGWTWFFFAYYSSFTVASLVLVARFRRTARFFRQRRQADLILGTGTATLLLGTAVDVVLPHVPNLALPSLAAVIGLIWASGLYYAVTRYRLMSVTPQAAARDILATMNDGLLLLTPEGSVAAANTGASNMLGLSPRELRGRRAERFFAEPGRFRAALDRLPEGAVSGLELDLVGTGQQKVPVSLSGRLMKDPGGEPVGSVWVMHDITPLRLAAEHQARLLEQVAAANQELAEFAYIVSHDLKAPLRGIDSLVRWLCADYGSRLDAAAQEHLSLLLSRVKRMHALIDGILQYSRVGRVREQAVAIDLARTVPEIIDLLAPPGHIKVVVENRLPVVYGEKTRVEQLFQNLLSNAIKYMDKPEGLVRVGCLTDGGMWKFYVADNGPGIREEDGERIFTLFSTGGPDQNHDSTGIGLAVVKKVVELYGGRVWVESVVGAGSTFFFTLPQSRSETASAAGGQEATKGVISHG